MTKNLSKCCKAKTKLGCTFGFKNIEGFTFHKVCLVCKNPCGIRYVVDRDWRKRLHAWIETPYGTEGRREELEGLIESIIENIEIEHNEEMDTAYQDGYEQGKKERSAKIYEQGRCDGSRETLAFISKEEGWDSPDLNYMKKLGLSDNPNT